MCLAVGLGRETMTTKLRPVEEVDKDVTHEVLSDGLPESVIRADRRAVVTAAKEIVRTWMVTHVAWDSAKLCAALDALLEE